MRLLSPDKALLKLPLLAGVLAGVAIGSTAFDNPKSLAVPTGLTVAQASIVGQCRRVNSDYTGVFKGASSATGTRLAALRVGTIVRLADASNGQGWIKIDAPALGYIETRSLSTSSCPPSLSQANSSRGPTVSPAIQVALYQNLVTLIKQRGAAPDGSHRFFVSYPDLNQDGRLDAIVVFNSSFWCGTGGCTMLVFAGQPDQTLRLVSESSLVRPPITVSTNRTNGWQDLLLRVSGGGMPAKNVALKFDGKKYPPNPSDLPSLPSSLPIQGKVLFPEGTVLQTLTTKDSKQPIQPVFYACNQNPANEIVATFYETNPPTARLERGDTVVTALQRPAASGAKYAAANVTFWSKGQTAMVEWRGEKLDCRVR